MSLTLYIPYHTVYQGTCYRLATDLPNVVLEGLVPGATFVDKGFLSTSTGTSFLDRKKGPAHTHFIIKSKTGRDVKRFSEYKEEDEVLFLDRTMFKISSVTIAQSGEKVVMMEELH